MTSATIQKINNEQTLKAVAGILGLAILVALLSAVPFFL